jgi:biotin transport system substrate-specific component
MAQPTTNAAERLIGMAHAPILRAALLVLGGTLLLTLSAKVQVPMWPVPMTLQSGVILIIGALYGARLGALTIAAYLVEGAFGLPVFAGTPERGIGLAYMVGPTGGYLLGFLVATWAVGALVERSWDRGLELIVTMALGSVIPLALGVAWLAQFVGLGRALDVGLTPFLVGAIVKLALAAAVVEVVRRAAERRAPV